MSAARRGGAGQGAPAPVAASLERIGRGAAIAGFVGAAVCVAGAAGRPAHFYQAYLVAWLFFLALTVGSSAVLMLHHMVGGMWGHVIRRILEAAARTLPVVGLLFLPALFGMEWLYPWSRSGALEGDPVLASKAAYLNVPFFLGRTVLYFAIWMFLAWRLRRLSDAQDAVETRGERDAGAPEPDDAPLGRRLRHVSAPGLAAYGLTATFAAIDWVMSLDPHWFSTAYGVLFILGQGLATLAFATLVVVLLRRAPSLKEVLDPAHLHDLGNLMLAFVMLHAYVAYSQLLIIWSGNLAEEVPWYTLRLSGGRQAIALALVVLHFGLPFLLLLHRPIKRNPKALAAIAALLLAMRLVDLHWIVSPAAPGSGALFLGLEAAAFVGIGGVWLAAFCAALRRRPLLPRWRPDGVAAGAPAEATR